MLSATNWVEAPATSRHTRHSLWLLPSGSDQVHKLVLREDQGLHRFVYQRLLAEEAEIIKHPFDYCKRQARK
jgi:hypothetical protein